MEALKQDLRRGSNANDKSCSHFLVPASELPSNFLEWQTRIFYAPKRIIYTAPPTWALPLPLHLLLFLSLSVWPKLPTTPNQTKRSQMPLVAFPWEAEFSRAFSANVSQLSVVVAPRGKAMPLIKKNYFRAWWADKEWHFFFFPFS